VLDGALAALLLLLLPVVEKAGSTCRELRVAWLGPRDGAPREDALLLADGVGGGGAAYFRFRRKYAAAVHCPVDSYQKQRESEREKERKRERERERERE
jgi:hypothetical protein